MMFDNLIFDFDGTISDSYPIFVKIYHTVAEERGMPCCLTDEELFRALMVNTKYAFSELGWDAYCTYPEFFKDFERLQATYFAEFQAFPEAIELLKYAKVQEKNNYLYTHSGAVVHKILQNMGIEDLFDFVLDASMGFPSKPAPDALLYLIREKGLDPARSLMIGDRFIDAEAGMNAGMSGCLWDVNGFYPDAKPTYRVSSLLEVKTLL